MTPQEKALLQQNASIGAQPTQSTSTPQPTGDIDFDKMAKKYNVNLPQTKVEPYVPSWKQEQPQQKGFLEMAGESVGNVLGSTVSGIGNIAGAVGGTAQALNPFSDAGFDLGKRAGQLAGAVGQGVQGIGQVANPVLAEAGRVASGAIQPTAQSFMGGISKVGEGLKRMGAGGLKDFAYGANTALTGGFQSLFSPLAGAMSVAPKEVTGTLGAVGQGVQDIKNMGIQAVGIDPNSEDGKQLSDALDNMLNIASLGAGAVAKKAVSGGVGKIKGAMPKGAETMWNNLDDAVRATAGKVGGIGAKVGESLSRIGKKTGEFAQDTMANSFFQTPSKVLKQVSSQGDDFLKAWDNKELYQQDVMSKIASSIDDVMGEKGAIGKMYVPLRSSNQKVIFKQGYADDVLKKFGLETSPEGVIQPVAGMLKNSRLTEAQLGQLNSKLGSVLPKAGEKFTTDQFLKLRDKVDEIADWGSTVNRADKPVMAAAQDLYMRLNEIAKKEGGIRGLEGLDKKFSAIKKEYQALQKEFMSTDAYGKPVLKPSIQAETVTRLLQPQNKSKLAMLEEYIPDLQKQLQVLDTVKQIEAASMRATGASMQRFGAAAAGGMVGSAVPVVGNALGALAGYLLSDPVQAARWFAKMGAKKAAKAVPSATSTFENIQKAVVGVKGSTPKTANLSVNSPVMKITDKQVSKVGDTLRKQGKQALGTEPATQGQGLPKGFTSPALEKLRATQSAVSKSTKVKGLGDVNPIVNPKTGETLNQAIEKLRKQNWSEKDITGFRNKVLGVKDTTPNIKPYTLKDNTLYHGTSAKNTDMILKGGFKKGSELSDDAYRGGGYGELQDSVSFSTDPKVADTFSKVSKDGVILQAKLKPDVKVATVKGIDYAEDLNGRIAELKKKGIGAVYLEGEKEIVVFDPKNVTTIKKYK